MFTYIFSFFNKFFAKQSVDEDEEQTKENFLAEQLLDIEILKEEQVETETVNREIPRNVACFQRTAYSISCQVNDKVLYLCYKDDNDSIIVVRVLENQGIFWGDSMDTEENQFQVIEHVIIGEVDFRQERLVYMKDSDLKFDLDDVEAGFIPMKGDWLELRCSIQWRDDKPADISAAQVMVEAIESNQGACTWRVIKMIITDNQITQNNTEHQTSEENITLDLERDKKLLVTHPLKFENVNIHQTANITLDFTNNMKVGAFPIPDRVWAAVLGDSEQAIYGNDYDKILDRLETALPCLCQELTVSNYLDRWHTLLYMEEIQANINMRVYDMSKVFLIHCQEYLGIEIKGLCERRPSLIKGDRVIVKDTWSVDSTQYEGYIHAIRGDLVLLKFNPQFHETYSGSDVSVEFHFNRSPSRRAHQAINLAISNLGPDILFPTRIVSRPLQVSASEVSNLQWYNQKLNPGQKAAVTNILSGECRPMPYCIYGPPGTGKTITVIETILQIISVFPDSRILVATPSNSAANLIAERLVQYKDKLSGSVIRLIANYLLDSENLPEVIKPFCATLDIAREETSKPNYQVRKDGINLNCQTSFVGRHRVTIGTCFCLGTLAQMGLPRGHFTHVIVDEAGQATEPEIMIPLTFVDKESCQIILAGDPMQLGPVIVSKYCVEYGMDESYLSRILQTFPYQRDFEAYQDGFNKKLVTKLNYNYRSLEEVLELPSKMFYDGSLVPKMDRSETWVAKCINTCSEVFDSTERVTGGIFVYGIKGVNARAEDSPSWFNLEEAAMVAMTTCKLYKRNITLDDIGIITPYIAQAKYLRVLFESMGLPQPKIGTVEEFQGQERPIILISTVRSSEANLPEDRKHALGFVQNPKRLNVALTRAQVAVILFCNPHILCMDPLWGKVIAQSVKEDKYKGCDLPHMFENDNKNDDLLC
ncbi:hypothetical protein MSG28_011124 [Choristoneura fumiferana]|uniref:Uncharacterized protein n=1 Tax=Choristoneura fumiferana TaxID=7141 RepID=A0ACC0KRD9_CHOFU|nr:hypothetical protein MSG28_011124 [Choristoneura fumiferana]